MLIASNWGQKHHPAWYFNLVKQPRATLKFDGHEGSYVAREIAPGDEYDRIVGVLADHCATEEEMDNALIQTPNMREQAKVFANRAFDKHREKSPFQYSPNTSFRDTAPKTVR